MNNNNNNNENSPPTTSNNNKTFFVSPRNETSAHAMAQTLLMPANENECNNNNSNSSEEYPLPPLELRQRVLEQLRSIRVQTLEKDAKDFEDIERARRQGIPTSTSASVVCKIETERVCGSFNEVGRFTRQRCERV